MNRRFLSLSFFLLTLYIPGFAIVGVGIHLGADASLQMENTKPFEEKVSTDKLDLDFSTIIPPATSIDATSLPFMFVNRSGWSRNINFGAKLYSMLYLFLTA